MPISSASSSSTTSQPRTQSSAAPERSVRPQARPTSTAATSTSSQAPETSIRPQARPTDTVEVTSEAADPSDSSSTGLLSGLAENYGEASEVGATAAAESTTENPYEGVADYSTSVKVEPWSSDRTPAEGQVSRNDHLEGILRNQGYEPADIYAADESGKTLLDRVAEANDLREANLIHPDQELVVPTLHAPEEASSPEPTEGPDDGSRAGQTPAEVTVPTDGPDDGSRAGQTPAEVTVPTDGPDHGSRAGQTPAEVTVPTEGPDDGSRAGQTPAEVSVPTDGPDDGSRAGQTPAEVSVPTALFEDGVSFRELPAGQARNYPTNLRGAFGSDDTSGGIDNMRDQRVQEVQGLIQGGEPLAPERAAEILGEGWTPIEGLPEGTSGFELATEAPGMAQRLVFNSTGVGLVTEQPITTGMGGISENAILMSPDGSVSVTRPSRVDSDNPGGPLVMGGEFVRAQ